MQAKAARCIESHVATKQKEATCKATHYLVYTNSILQTQIEQTSEVKKPFQYSQIHCYAIKTTIFFSFLVLHR